MGSFEDNKTTGTIFNIQKYSVHDGPGIRTIVFLKGCPLSCAWCSNPESQSMKPQLAHNKGRCLTTEKCTRCLKACPNGAISEADDHHIQVDRAKCEGCESLACAHACPSKGLIIYGEQRNVKSILDAVEQDAVFYSRSGGGMTLSGGEPLFQRDFALALLREARRRRIKTAIETCGQVPWEVLREAAPNLNTVLFDIKTVDSEKHKKMTGVGNERILENLKNLLTEFPNLPVLVRTPIIPGFNDTDEDAAAIGRFLAGHANVSYEALPYHRLGTQKYEFLGIPYPLGDIALPKEKAERFQKMVDTARALSAA